MFSGDSPLYQQTTARTGRCVQTFAHGRGKVRVKKN